MASRIPMFILDMLGQFRFYRGTLRARVGLGDPADTGQLYGMLQPVLLLANQSRSVHLQIAPEFNKVQLSGEGELIISLQPVTLIAPIWRFAHHARP